MEVSRANRFNFPLLFLGQLISQFGDSIFHIGLVWLSLELTGSKTVSGFVVAAGYLPAILLALAAGVVADRVDRRRLMMACAGLQAVLVACIPLLHTAGLLSAAFLALVAFGLASGAAFFNPARDALTPTLVPPERLTRANSLVQISAQLAFLAGPAAAGLLAAQVGTIHLFSLDAVTFLVSLLTLSFIRLPPARVRHLEAAPVPLPQVPPAAGGSWHDLVEGLHHAWSDKRLRGLLLLTAVENLIIMGPAILGTPVYVREVLGFGDQGVQPYALLTAVLFAGMITSSLVIGMKGRSWPRGKLIVMGILLDGMTFIPFFFIRSFESACVAMFVHGLTVPMITVPRATLIQKIVPDDRRGRIFALVNLAVVGCTALSMVLTGVASDHIGMETIYLGAGLLGTACGLAGTGLRALWRT